MKVISPFGPKIAKLKFPNKLIKKINNEVDQILNKKSLLKKLDYSKKLVGQVKQEFQLPKSFVKKNLEKVISNEVKKYIFKTIQTSNLYNKKKYTYIYKIRRIRK